MNEMTSEMSTKVMATWMSVETWLGKWEKFSKDGILPKIGSDECPLCRAFLKGRCRKCPIFKVTNLESCKETPYMNVLDWYYSLDYGNSEDINTIAINMLKAIEAEYAFLVDIALKLDMEIENESFPAE